MGTDHFLLTIPRAGHGQNLKVLDTGHVHHRAGRLYHTCIADFGAKQDKQNMRRHLVQGRY